MDDLGLAERLVVRSEGCAEVLRAIHGAGRVHEQINTPPVPGILVSTFSIMWAEFQEALQSGNNLEKYLHVYWVCYRALELQATHTSIKQLQAYRSTHNRSVMSGSSLEGEACFDDKVAK